ncbi:hypothetical protein [Gorillibacterium sp. CAU 1737]|uniref:hypothetical protein n=1 Tax=Gorillibacterium sp. CAU 1737 TaxID=3140362 RepID=UPI00326050A3
MKRAWMAVLILAVAVMLPSPVSAAVEITPTVVTAFEKLTAAAPADTAGKLRSRYAEFVETQAKERSSDQEIASTRTRAEETRLEVAKRMKEWDTLKLSRLEKQVKELKERRQPLFDSYSLLQQQLSVAKSLKSKSAITLTQAQLNALKIPVQLAREEIKQKEASLKEAKAARTAHLKKVRSVLAEVDSVNLKLKTERSKASAANKIVTAESKVFSAAARKGDASGTLASLNRLSPSARDTLAAKQRMLELERKRKGVVEQALSLLPAS